jgi:WD40 repeat protein
VAYRTEKEVQTLVVRSIDGNDFYEFPDPNNEWQVLFGWLDNTTLILIDYSGINAIDPTALNQPSNDKVVLFNPFTREKRISGDLYPDMVIPGGLLKVWPSPVIYSPSQRYMVYLGGSDYRNYLAIWDLEKEKLIAKTPEGFIDSPPLWLNDKEFVYVYGDTLYASEDIFSGNISGEVTKLTSLGKYFGEETKIDSISISPAGHYLSFESNNRLLILDMMKKQTKDYCLFSIKGKGIWSPDGRYLAVVSGVDETNSKIIIIDVEKEQAFSISDLELPQFSGYIVGWVANWESMDALELDR